jgi:hypothetical protein
MKNKLFDEHVNEQFGNYKPSVPSHIWENIVAKKGKEKPVAFLFSRATKIAVALFILIASGLLIYLFSSKGVVSKENIAATGKNKILVESQSTTVNTQTQRDEIKTKSTTSSINLKEEHNNQAIIDKKENKKVTENVILKNSLEIPSSTGKNRNIKSRFLVKISKSDEAIKDEIIKIISNKSEEKFLSASYLFNAELLKFKKEFSRNLILPSLPKIPFIPCPEAEKNIAGNKQYLEIYGGPDFIYKNYSDTANSDYLKTRKASTGINYAYSAGLRYTKVFNNGVSLRTGFNYSQINENLTAKKGFLLERVYIVNNIGDTVNSYTKSTSQFERTTNIYRSIDIPLMMGYELGNGRLHTNISTGIMVNVFSKQLGSVLDKDGKVVDITSGKTTSIYQYKTNAGISVLGSLSVYYKLNEKLHIMAEPYFKYSLSSFTKPDITLKEKFHTVGLKFGLRWDL